MITPHFHADYIGSQGKIVWVLSDGRSGSDPAPPGLAHNEALRRFIDVAGQIAPGATFEFYMEEKPNVKRTQNIH
jgi:hypothetical protein